LSLYINVFSLLLPLRSGSCLLNGYVTLRYVTRDRLYLFFFVFSRGVSQKDSYMSPSRVKTVQHPLTNPALTVVDSLHFYADFTLLDISLHLLITSYSFTDTISTWLHSV